MAEWLWAVPWPMPLKPHTERRQEFGQGRTTYPSQAAPNIGEGNIPISKYMFAKMYNLPIQSCTKHIRGQPTQPKTNVCTYKLHTLSNLVLIGVSRSRLRRILHFAFVFCICLLYLYSGRRDQEAK